MLQNEFSAAFFFFFTLSVLLLLQGWFPAKFVEILDERSKEVKTVKVYDDTQI